MHIITIVDTVVETGTSRIYNILSPHHGKEILILKLLEKRINVLPEYLENKEIYSEIKKGSFNNKRYNFTIYRKGKYLISAEEL